MSKIVPDDIRQQIYDDKKPARKWYGRIFTGVAVGQLLFMDYTLYKVGIDNWHLGQGILSVFVTGIFGSIIGLVTIVLKYYYND